PCLDQRIDKSFRQEKTEAGSTKSRREHHRDVSLIPEREDRQQQRQDSRAGGFHAEVCRGGWSATIAGVAEALLDLLPVLRRGGHPLAEPLQKPEQRRFHRRIRFIGGGQRIACKFARDSQIARICFFLAANQEVSSHRNGSQDEEEKSAEESYAFRHK